MWEAAKSTDSVDPPQAKASGVNTHYTAHNGLRPSCLAIGNVHQQMWPRGFAELWVT